jgi:imidazolonepropionase-like amidohydrolase
VDYDLRGLTVLPGWIDAHVHITWIFGKDGKNGGTEGTTQEDAYQAASNAWVTLMAGFTTVQSVGAPNDIPLRDAIAKGVLPGPRILTANEPLEGRSEATGTSDEIRAYVRKQKQAGADLIKIFASKFHPGAARLCILRPRGPVKLACGNTCDSASASERGVEGNTGFER